MGRNGAGMTTRDRDTETTEEDNRLRDRIPPLHGVQVGVGAGAGAEARTREKECAAMTIATGKAQGETIDPRAGGATG